MYEVKSARSPCSTTPKNKGRAYQGRHALEFNFIPTRDDLFGAITMTSSSSSSVGAGFGLSDFVEIRGRSKFGVEVGAGGGGDICSGGVAGRNLAISRERREGKEGRPRRIGWVELVVIGWLLAVAKVWPARERQHKYIKSVYTSQDSQNRESMKRREKKRREEKETPPQSLVFDHKVSEFN